MNSKEYLLVCAGEECTEVAQDISKALRFGLEDVNFLQPDGPTNRERIASELNDLMGVIEMMESFGILPTNWRDRAKITAKNQKVMKMMQYSKSVGVLEKETAV